MLEIREEPTSFTGNMGNESTDIARIFSTNGAIEKNQIAPLVCLVGRIALNDREEALRFVDEITDMSVRVNVLAELGKVTEDIMPIVEASTILDNLTKSNTLTSLNLSRKYVTVGLAAANIDREFATETILRAPRESNRILGLCDLSDAISKDGKIPKSLNARRQVLVVADNIMCEADITSSKINNRLMVAAENVDLHIVYNAFRRKDAHKHDPKMNKYFTFTMINSHLNNEGGFERLAREIPDICIGELEKALQNDPESIFSLSQVFVVSARLLEKISDDNYEHRSSLNNIYSAAKNRCA